MWSLCSSLRRFWHYCPVSDIEVFKVPDLKCPLPFSGFFLFPTVYQRERQPISQPSPLASNNRTLSFAGGSSADTGIILFSSAAHLASSASNLRTRYSAFVFVHFQISRYTFPAKKPFHFENIHAHLRNSDNSLKRSINIP